MARLKLHPYGDMNSEESAHAKGKKGENGKAIKEGKDESYWCKFSYGFSVYLSVAASKFWK